MPVLKVYQHGMTAGCPPGLNSHRREKRGAVKGWSNGSARSNTLFLRSVEEWRLPGLGYALSLSVTECPPSHDDWTRARRAFFKRLERMELLCAHWLTEWQRRGVPHLHAAVWLPMPDSPWGVAHLGAAILEAWLAVTLEYRSGKPGQHVVPMTDSVGWFQYLSKHASRGMRHYQRCPENIPKGWRGVTGRMWGNLGNWPLRQAMKLEMGREAFWLFRRLVRGWRKADARAEKSPAKRSGRIKAARSMLRCRNRRLSEVRGISEWMEVDDQLTLLGYVNRRGYEVQQVE